jgi:hypothetical protein
MPGGTPSDPLNLQGLARGEVIPPPSPIPEVKKSYNVPVNNFIPVNQSDPLGLLQPSASMPPAFMYKTHKRRKKRPDKKKKDSVSTAGDASATMSESGMDSDADGTGAGASASDTRASVSDTEAAGKAGMRSHGSGMRISETMEVTAEGDTGESKDSLMEKSGTDEASSRDTELASGASESAIPTSTTLEGPPLKKRKSADGSSLSVQGSSENLAKPQTSVPVTEVSSSTSQQQPSDELAPCLLDVPVSRLEPSSELNIPLYMKEIEMTQVTPQDLDFPVNKKALRKALRIAPVQDIKKEIKLQEKKHRDWVRKWRNPHLESPADSIEGTPSREPETEELKVDTSAGPSTTTTSVDPVRGRAFPKGPVSRNVDSIVSPILRTERSQARKRRRTISECSLDSISNVSGSDSATKALTLRQSSSPDVGAAVKGKGLRPRVLSYAGGSKLKRKQEAEKTVTPTPPLAPVKFSKNPVFKHGNYTRYYGYRTPELEPDFRIPFMRREWFVGKDVLDIGCNAGHVTLAIAQLFHPQKIVGMDIDPNLIRMARQNIKRCQTKDQLRVMKKFPDSTAEYGPIEPLPALTNPSNVFPKNIMFMQVSVILPDLVHYYYDTTSNKLFVLCQGVMSIYDKNKQTKKLLQKKKIKLTG